MDRGFRQWLKQQLREWRQTGLLRCRRKLHSGQGPRLRLGRQEVVNFASNDYLNLANDRRVVRAAIRALIRYGCGAGASPLIIGWSTPLRALECDLAQWQLTESALVFPSGFAANLGVLTALAGPEDVIFSDALNHASLIDGCRLSRAQVLIYRHGDADHLRSLIRDHVGTPGSFKRPRRAFIVTDSVFSMDGDAAPLEELVEIAEQYQAVLIVDEAHATALFGPEGRGLVATLSRWPSSGLVKIGTLSKALGSQGGFVCGDRVLIRFLVNRARSYIFSTALNIAAAAAARQALRLARQQTQRRDHLFHLARQLRQSLSDRGLIPPVFEKKASAIVSPIVPVVLGDPERAVAVSRALLRHGFLVPAIRPPSVPPGTSRLRISLTAGHTEEDVERMVECLAKVLA